MLCRHSGASRRDEPGIHFTTRDALRWIPGSRGARPGTVVDDHPAARRYSDRIDTVTADSVLDWLVRSKLAQAAQVVVEPRP